MKTLRAGFARLGGLFRSESKEREFADELASHIDLHTEENLRAGMSPEEARRAACIRLGGATAVCEKMHEQRGIPWIEEFLQDLRYAARMLRHSPGFAVVAMVTLALGIGANTAIFSFIDNVLLKPIPYPNPDRIVRVIQKRVTGAPFSATTLDLLDWQKQNTVFENLAGLAGFSPTLTTEGQPVLLRGARVSHSYFDIYGTKPFLGRNFLPEEDQYGKDHVVLLTHALWVSQFGSDTGIVGRTIRLDSQDYQVVGVLPPGGAYDRSFYQIVKPLAFAPSEMTRGYHWLGGYARLKPGVTLEQARVAMDSLAAEYAKQYPDDNKGFGVRVERLSDVIVGPQLRSALYVLFAAAGMVLLIGCANLANLTLSRGVARAKEVAVRASLGAERGRLMRQFLTENLLLAVLGGALGIGLGFLAIRGMQVSMPANTLPPEANLQMDGRVMLFAIAISIFTGLLFGLAPALQVTKPDLTHAMKDSGRATASGARSRLRNGLVMGEVALAFVLLCGAGLLIRSFFRLESVDLGFDSNNVLTMGLATPTDQYPDPNQLNAYLRNLRLAVEGVPGVEEAAYTTGIPLRGTGLVLPIQLAGTELVARPYRGLYFFKTVSPGYFRALGIQVRKGRAFDEHDNQSAPLVVVINERLAARLFPGKDPLGQRILIPRVLPGKPSVGEDLTWTVVGVIGNERVNTLNDETSEGVYAPWDQTPTYNPTLMIHSGIDPRRLQTAIRSAVDSVNKNQVLSNIRTMDEIKAESMVSDRMGVILMATFSGIALLLAAVGIYGVISYAVSQRTNEMGIRAALGADRGRILSLVLGNGLALTGVGLALGLGGSLALMGLLRTQLYGVGVRDPLTMLAVAAILMAVAAIACYIPARRATRTDPAIALRYE